MARKAVLYLFFGYRRSFHLLPTLVASCLFVWFLCGWLVIITSNALLPPPPPDQTLGHFRRNRSLAHYLDNIRVLIEPSITPCSSSEEVPVIILVSSAPFNIERRLAVRATWGKHQPTYFVVGLSGDNVDRWLVDNYIEAKQYGDMVIFRFHDHYQNLTLKTALMLSWTLARCPQAEYMFKTDDDVLVNPWTLKTVLEDNQDAVLLGYQKTNAWVHRDEYTKWYMPRWLYPSDVVPQYLSGTGYLIRGTYIEKILKQANQIPLVNLEDIYFTYEVSYKSLRLLIRHDRRLSPYKPWLKISCAYWSLASIHSLSPDEMLRAWSKIKSIASSKTKCTFFKLYLDSDFLLY